MKMHLITLNNVCFSFDLLTSQPLKSMANYQIFDIFVSSTQEMISCLSIMTSSNGNIFRVTSPLCWEFTGPGEFPHKGQWRGALMFSLICAWINDWVNNREAGDLRRYGGHYDVNVMNFEFVEHHIWSIKCMVKYNKPVIHTDYLTKITVKTATLTKTLRIMIIAMT